MGLSVTWTGSAPTASPGVSWAGAAGPGYTPSVLALCRRYRGNPTPPPWVRVLEVLDAYWFILTNHGKEIKDKHKSNLDLMQFPPLTFELDDTLASVRHAHTHIGQGSTQTGGGLGWGLQVLVLILVDIKSWFRGLCCAVWTWSWNWDPVVSV
ncbi:unnamed protein product [Gadus morhua 'NCC']